MTAINFRSYLTKNRSVNEAVSRTFSDLFSKFDKDVRNEITASKAFKDVSKVAKKAGFELNSLYALETPFGRVSLVIDIGQSKNEFFDLDKMDFIMIDDKKSFDEGNVVKMRTDALGSKDVNGITLSTFVDELVRVSEFVDFLNNYKFNDSNTVIVTKEQIKF